MAAPPDINCTNLTGKFVMNKSLSDDMDPFLTLQGLSWFTRKAIALATVVLTIREYFKDALWHIDITSVASGLSTTQEDRTLDWQDRDHEDKIFGKCRGKSRLFKKGEYQMEGPGSPEDAVFLQADKLKDGKTDSRFVDEEHVQSIVKQVGGGDWTAEQVWGFEEINGERRYTRRLIVWKAGKEEKCRLVYDYKGAVEKDDDDEDLAYGEE
ncbi:hypothetical protein EDD37DRAFT_616076 [Exophiala viscosa]|uniref:uncharacterized protein n=1 Tax=Exophiala viscosa TaxID=2486360 RepID=UPI00218E6723|nr:hypothetical protein EDD37DRAFT_616076 [Exophiala viscosa]